MSQNRDRRGVQVESRDTTLTLLKTRLPWLIALGLAVAIGVGLVLPDSLLFLFTIALAKSLVVLGLMLLMRAGLVSFGQGLFFATGAYTVGFAMNWLGLAEALLLVPVGVLVSMALAALLGPLVSQYREIFFAMFTLALSMILYGILVKTYEVTGGSDGMGIRPPTFLGWTPPEGLLRLVYYYFTLLLVAVAIYVVSRFLASPMGYLAQAIRDNEVRVEYLGSSVRRVVYWNYLIAGGLGGLGGVLFAFTVGHITPDSTTYWMISGEFVFIALLSGTGSALAPVAGSVVFGLLRSFALKYVAYTWQMAVGITMLLIILFLPQGLWSLYDVARRRWITRWKPP